jgi:cytochrome c peroxidase
VPRAADLRAGGGRASNGLDAGETRVFKAPSLRSVGLTGPYMHDGRFATLAEVVAFYDHGNPAGPALDDRLRQTASPQRLNLGAADQAALVAFLVTLNDPRLTTDVRFSDPFRPLSLARAEASVFGKTKGVGSFGFLRLFARLRTRK